jgi:DNA-binding CsgD family transcriptional regulator
VSPGRPCPHCATVGSLAASTKAALSEVTALADELRQLLAAPVEVDEPAPVKSIGGRGPALGPRRLLTAREKQVLECVRGGLENVEIGKRLWISESTVKTYLRRMMLRFHARSRAHLVDIAWRRGFLGKDES